MVQFFSAPIVRNERLWDRGLDSLQTSFGDSIEASYLNAKEGEITPLISRAIGGAINDDDSPLLQPQEANEQYGINRNGKSLLKWDEPVRKATAERLHGLRIDDLKRQDLIDRGPSGFWTGAAQFGAAMTASMTDPVNVLSSMIPVFGQAKYASMIANAGSAIGRTGVRAGVGATEGVIGALLTEPVVYALSRSEQRDYTMADSMINLAFGAVLGGGLHMAIRPDRTFRKIGLEQLIDERPMATKEAALAEALSATLEGRAVRADLAIREDLLGGSSLRTPYEMAAREFDNRMGPFGPPEKMAIDMDGIRVGVEPPHPMASPTTSSFPVLARNGEAMSFATARDAENAARRIERDQGYRPSVFETPEGFTLRREATIEPVRKSDGSTMTFENERQAQRYREQILKDENLDVMRVSDPEGGPHRFALVAGASEKELAAAAKAPHLVDLGRSDDIAGSIDRRAQDITAQRSSWENEYRAYMAERRNPVSQVHPVEAKALANADALLQSKVGTRQALDREGGRTELSMLEREVSVYDQRFSVVEKNGELPAEARAYLDEGKEIAKQAQERASIFESLGNCLRGTA